MRRMHIQLVHIHLVHIQWMSMVSMVCLLITGGCVMTPKTLRVTDISATFEQGTILSGRTGNPVTFPDMISELSQARIVYVGEKHNNPDHHRIQLQIIKTLYRDHPDLSVGMEMFDFTYQPVLNEWCAGNMDETTFLKRVHWYANWKYPFRLYRDILIFIKQHHFPLIGLNIPFYLPPKIAIGGIESLTDIERNYLPKEIDTSNPDHRDYVRKVFEQHHHMQGRGNFETFYQAQCAWDDGMAESIARHIETSNMVVLAGNGHIYRKFGIPERAYRRTGLSFKTVYLAPVDTDATLSDGDFIWVTATHQIQKRYLTNF